ncbi:DUF7373 family lipoprotein [Nocardia tengchongensis]|uniref:DUF7373 family lipoprotein n=1 Tax=Nocardia tengchongensis TaxID=2055889 RepID=UPI003646B948
MVRNPETSRFTSRTAFGALVLILFAAVLSGCGSRVAGTPAAGEINIRNLGVGTYPTDPLDVRVRQSFGSNPGTAVAMARLTDSVVNGADVDAKFAHNVVSEPLWNAVALPSKKILGSAFVPVLESNGMLFGFSSASSTHELATPAPRGSEVPIAFSPFAGAQVDTHATSFTVTVLQFPDPPKAKTAAEQLEAADFANAADRNVHVDLAGRPDAKAHWQPGVPALTATLAHGSYVVIVHVDQPTPDLDGLRKFTEQVFTAQLPLLDQAPALSPRDYFRMQFDPDTMMRRTLHPRDYTSLDAVAEITGTPRGYLHYVDDHAALWRLLDDNGVDRFSTAKVGGLLFRARDAKAAAALWSGINKTTTASVEAPPNVPDVACTETPHPESGASVSRNDTWDLANKYICTLHYDRYVARVASNQLIDAQQKAAAQYALLAKSQYL